jgi:hypothetical protein
LAFSRQAIGLPSLLDFRLRKSRFNSGGQKIPPLLLLDPDGGIGDGGQGTQDALHFQRMNLFPADFSALSETAQQYQFVPMIPFAGIVQQPPTAARRHCGAFDFDLPFVERNGNAAQRLPH